MTVITMHAAMAMITVTADFGIRAGLDAPHRGHTVSEMATITSHSRHRLDLSTWVRTQSDM